MVLFFKKATPLEKKWEDHYQKVILFKQQNGHWLLPVKSPGDEGFIENRKLRNWIATQKSDYNAGCMREDRLKKLRDIGFPLDNTCVGTRVQVSVNCLSSHTTKLLNLLVVEVVLVISYFVCQ